MSGWFTVDWCDGAVVMLDQRRLPTDEVYNTYTDVAGVAEAIRSMVIRGAPAIGVAAAMGVALGAQEARTAADLGVAVEDAIRTLGATRPTAVNLFWGLQRMRTRLTELQGLSLAEQKAALVSEGQAILAEDIAACRALGRHGAALIPDGARILTHCNAGALATGGYGTALGVIRAAVEAGKRVTVFADETRPYLQGARLTAWELHKDGIDVTVIADVAAGHLMQRGEIDCAIVGSDRTVRNGDVCNKIGTYGVATLAHANGLPFYAAVPISTIDLTIEDGRGIPIEERGAEEVVRCGGARLVPEGVKVRNPAFDVTPAKLVTAIVTERGVARAPYTASLAALAERR